MTHDIPFSFPEAASEKYRRNAIKIAELQTVHGLFVVDRSSGEAVSELWAARNPTFRNGVLLMVDSVATFDAKAEEANIVVGSAHAILERYGTKWVVVVIETASSVGKSIRRMIRRVGALAVPA